MSDLLLTSTIRTAFLGDTDRGRALATQHGVLFAPGVLLDGGAFGYGRLAKRKLRRTLAAA